MELLKEPFEMFTDLIKNKYDNTLTSEMRKNIEDFKESLKDKNFEQSERYVPWCLNVDKEFEQFLNRYE